uniref:Transmembrane protein n=1 Tax=Salix viminalis TaxID=40686 RepID=A0A6N2KI70_SALVM
MEAQESCGRTWQFRVLWGDLVVADMVKIPLFLRGMHPGSFNHLRPCMDHGKIPCLSFLLLMMIVLPVGFLVYF